MNDYIECYFEEDEDIQHMDLPKYILHMTRENTMLLVRKMQEGPRIVRQLNANTGSVDTIHEKLQVIVPERTNIRFLFAYIQFEYSTTKYEVNVPIEEYYVDNELLSFDYLISYMEHQWIWNTWKIDWNRDYFIKIMDTDLKMFEVKKNEYVRLEKDSVVICRIHKESSKEDPSLNDESKETEESKETDSNRVVRTLSMEDDGDMLMLFSSLEHKKMKHD
jgi:hypothetical protein